MDKWFTVKVVAANTGTCPSFWRKLCARRQIPFYKFGRGVRLKEADVAHFLGERCCEARETVADCTAQRGHVGPEPVTPARP